MFQFLRERFLLLDQARHLRNGSLKNLRSVGGRDGLGEYVGEAGEKANVIFVKCIYYLTIDLKNAEGRSCLGRDQDVGCRDDAMIRVESWQSVGVCLSYIRTELRFAGFEGQALR